MKRQRGFTLLELMVAMAIFAMLAVAGWQVFDSVNRARERAQTHADNLAEQKTDNKVCWVHFPEQ